MSEKSTKATTELQQAIIAALSETSDLSLGELSAAVDWPGGEFFVRLAVREMVKGGLLKMKEDSVEHCFLYRLAA